VQGAQSGYVLRSTKDLVAGRIGDAPIFRRIIPTALDRAKMDLIVTRQPESDLVLSALGESMITLRGRGGTGKTIMLLQAAWHAFEARALRSLVLTYNHALAADIRRILALMNVPADPDGGGLTVETVMGFMYRWFRELAVLDESADFSEEQYRTHCSGALELIEGGAIGPGDVREIISGKPDHYDYDCIIVDEAQDWPQVEADLLKALYDPSRIALADGVDQLVRGGRTDWTAGVSRDRRQLVPLERCLRMKRNLASFANSVADVGSIKWQVEPNDKAGGGRVIILRRPYLEYPDLHEGLVAQAKSAGNAELDFLMCVPSSTICATNEHKVSDLGRQMREAGYNIWEGVDPNARKDFPRSCDQYRIVQYASCRGLEGWTVLLEGLDEYWEECRYWRHAQGLTELEEIACEDIDGVSEKEAWRRVLIGMTRPIDTLVISLKDWTSIISEKLATIAADSSDFVELYE
jgi:hypothetical protein